jgi:uncharacterized protein YkwD
MPVAHAPAHHHAYAASADRVEIAIVRIVNDIRRRYGIPSMRMSRTLDATASAHSWDMLRHNFLGHDASDGTPFALRMRRYTRARSIGETVMWTSGRGRPGAIVAAWMRSPPHRADLLSRAYHRIGVGRARGGRILFVTADLSS